MRIVVNVKSTDRESLVQALRAAATKVQDSPNITGSGDTLPNGTYFFFNLTDNDEWTEG